MNHFMNRIILHGPSRIVEVIANPGKSGKETLEKFVSWLDEYKRYDKREGSFYYFTNDSYVSSSNLKARRMGLNAKIILK